MAKLGSVTHRHGRRFRALAVALGLALVVAVLVGVKGAQIASLMAMGKQMERDGPPPEAVASAKASSQSWERTLAAVGSVSGVRSVTVSNEVPGRVTRILFESGARVREGQPLVELDADIERAQLASAKARRELAETNAQRFKIMADKNAITRAQWDEVRSQLETATKEYDAVRAQTDRKLVRAPFKGRLGIRAVNVGQYLAPGTTVTTLDAVGASFVDFTLPQEELTAVTVGMPVRISLGAKATRPGAEAGETIEGAITAIDPTIDPATRNLRLRAQIPPGKTEPPPGMFVRVEVILPKQATVVAVPATAIVHAPYGDSVFVLEPKPPDAPGLRQTPDGKPVKVARQQFVRTGAARGDFVEVAKGVEPGQEVVSAGAFKLRNKSPVFVDNSIATKPELDPHPENR